MLVHNAKHITIPLLKQCIQQCSECLHYFPSIESLEWHTINKHPHITKKDYVPELLQSFVNKEPTVYVKMSAEVNEEIIKKESVLQSLVEREPVMILKKENFTVDKSNDIYEISDDDDDDDLNNIDDTLNVDVKSDTNVVKCNEYDVFNSNNRSNYFEYNNLNGNAPPIKERLRFEDEIDNDPIISDLTTDCKVNLEMLDKNWIQSFHKPAPLSEMMKKLSNNVHNNNHAINDRYIQDVWRKNATVLGNKASLVKAPMEFWNMDSVHYEELVTSGSYSCAKCGRPFPNR